MSLKHMKEDPTGHKITLEKLVEKLTAELEQANNRLVKSLEAHKKVTNELKKSKNTLLKEQERLEETNTALKILLRQSSSNRTEIEQNILTNIKNLLCPYIDDLEKRLEKEDDRVFLKTIKSNINNITSSFARELSSHYTELTPREIQVADLIKQGRTNKDIARLLNITANSVDFHRSNIRNKFKLKGKKIGLRQHLHTFVG